MIRIDDLEQKAKAATFVDMRDGMRAYTAMEFNDAMNPTTALALIRVSRAASSFKDFIVHCDCDDEDDCSCGFMAMKKALMEIGE